MLKLFRPRNFQRNTARKYTAYTTLIGNSLKGEGVRLAFNRTQGWDKVLLNKLSFFHLTRNVFTAY